MDIDEDDEYMNAAAAHAAFVMTVSAASMYWLLRHAQHVHDILFISSTHFPKNRLGPLCRIDVTDLHSGTDYIENSRVRSMIDFFADFSQNFSARALLGLKNSITISMTNIGTVEPVTLKKAVFVPWQFQSRFQSRFLHTGTPLLGNNDLLL